MCHSQLNKCSLLLAALVSLCVMPSLCADVADDITAARTAWLAEDVQGAIGHLENALSSDPAHEEANLLMGAVKLLNLVEDPTFEALLTDAGAHSVTADLFHSSYSFDFYLETEVLGENASAWLYQTEESVQGGDAARSGEISHGELSAMEVTLSGSGFFQFDYKVSSESGFDFLEVYWDGEMIFQRSGELPWSTYQSWVDDNGEHQLLFIYRKDGSEDGGSDTAWIDNVRLEGVSNLAFGNTLSAALDADAEVRSVADEAVQALTPTEIPVFDASFTSTDVLDWLTATVAPRFEEVQLHLEKVSSIDFLAEFTSSETTGLAQEVDYYDVLMLRALSEGFLAVVGVLDAHNIDFFLDALAQRHLLDEPLDVGNTGPSHLHLQWLFETYPHLLELSPSADLSEEELAIRNLKDLYFAASDGIFARSSEARRLFNAGRERPAADTAWFSQTIETHDGSDALQSGNLKQWGLESTSVSIIVEGPGTLEYWWKISNFTAVTYPAHALDLYRRGAGVSYDSWMKGIWGESDWAQVSVTIPAGVQTLEWRYSLYGDDLSSVDGGFLDQVVYTPDGGSAVVLQPGASSLDRALDASLNASSENVLVDSLGLSIEKDLELRTILADVLTAFDGLLVTSVGDVTLRPLLDGEVDTAQLRPDFYYNQMIRGSFPDPTLAGMLPGMTQGQFEQELMLRAPDSLTASAEISVSYGGTDIADGDTAPSTSDGTDFGSADYTSGSVTHTFRVRNTGNATLTLGDESSSNSGEFSVSGLNSSISAGSYDDFTVTFAPSACGFVTAEISFSTNDNDENPFNFMVSGVGLVSTPTPVYYTTSAGVGSYPTVEGGDEQTTPVLTVIATTTGVLDPAPQAYMVEAVVDDSVLVSARIQVSIKVLQASRFDVYNLDQPDAGQPVPGSQVYVAGYVNASGQFAVISPSFATSTELESWIFTTSLDDASFDNIRETEVINSSEIAFGISEIGSTPIEHSFRVTNSCTSTASFAVESDSSEFVVSGLSGSIAGGGSSVFTVAFDPSSEGGKDATISITNDFSSNSFDFNVSGVGEGADVATTWYDGASVLGGGWLWSDWFGFFNVNQYPWVYHQEHGWLYAFAIDTESMFFWDDQMGTFFWTSDSVYPSIYRFSDSKWLFYQKESSNPRWFVDLLTGIWEQW